MENQRRKSPASKQHRRSTSRSKQNEFKEFRSYLLTLDQKLDNLKTDVEESTSSNKSTTFRLSKKLLNLGSLRKIKSKGNRIQLEFNISLLENLEEALDPSNREPIIAKQKIQEAIANLEKRNKLVKLADKSEVGWAIADEYQKDQLASNSEDDRKIRKAKKAAKAKSESSNFKRHSDSYGIANDLFRSQRQPQREALIAIQGQSKTPKPNDICFTCGGYGHWRENCK